MKGIENTFFIKVLKRVGLNELAKKLCENYKKRYEK